MMGRAVASLDIPVTKGTSGILLMQKEESKRDNVLPAFAVQGVFQFAHGIGALPVDDFFGKTVVRPCESNKLWTV
jgi:hypothetical protein